ncbi:MAG: SMP-30/gluconolactonase/LRE family protein [Micromonosporaceae bacterium]
MDEPRILLTGLAMGESPRWHEGRLWVCDWGAGEVLAVALDGTSEIVTRVQAFPFCIDWDADGRLLIITGDGRLLRHEADGSLTPRADLTSVEGRHPWNEIVVDGRGLAYVNNIGFEFPAGPFAPGIIAVVASDGSARPVADGVAFPNGMVVTPDDSTLIVAESYAGRLTAFDLSPDGSLSNRRIWAEIPGSAPDGICLDVEGAVWYGDVPNRRCVRVREGGEVLQTVKLDRGCFACALGGPDGRTLFMVANKWSGPDGMAGGERTGRVLAVGAPGAGWRS